MIFPRGGGGGGGYGYYSPRNMNIAGVYISENIHGLDMMYICLSQK